MIQVAGSRILWQPNLEITYQNNFNLFDNNVEPQIKMCVELKKHINKYLFCLFNVRPVLISIRPYFFPHRVLPPYVIRLFPT